jgi:hypothetical protein
MRLQLAATILALTIASVTIATAQDQPPYLDDRSTAGALVQSLYNAVNRKEYARAWSYFNTPPAVDLGTYAKGFEATESVDVMTGKSAEEGAAGSAIFTLPVVIRSTQVTGQEQVFAGCYTLRLANPQIQADDFRPLAIERGALQPTNQPFEEAMPKSCDGLEMPGYNTKVERARAMFVGGRSVDCPLAAAENDDPASYAIKYRYAHEADGDPEHTATVIRFICDRGAYNERTAYYLANDEDDIVRPLQFAMPELDVRYEDQEQAKLESVNVIGFNAVSELVNAEYDAATQTLTSHSLWRGIGDASSLGKWIFRHGDFALVKFDVDPTYDDKSELQNVLDYDTGP